MILTKLKDKLSKDEWFTRYLLGVLIFYIISQTTSYVPDDVRLLAKFFGVLILIITNFGYYLAGNFENPQEKKLALVSFFVLSILGFAYLAAAINAGVAIIIILSVFILLSFGGAMYIGLRALWERKEILSIALLYVCVAAIAVLIFTYLFLIFGAFGGNEPKPDINKSTVANILDFYYFSALLFYGNAFGDIVPAGFSKLLVVIELVVSFIIHSIILAGVVGSVYPKCRDKKSVRDVSKMDISEILDNIKKAEENNNAQSTKDFSGQIAVIDKQYELLTEFLVNLSTYKIEIPNHDSYTILHAIFYDSLKKSKMCKELAINGYYDESLALIRRIFDNTTHIIYLSQNPKEWSQWITYVNYQQDRYEGKSPKNPKTAFNKKEEDFLKLINMQNYYRLYGYLSNHIHTSSEALRTSIEPLELGKKGQLFHYAPRYRSDKLELCLNLIFGFMNDSFWKGFKDSVVFIDSIPSVLKEYKDMQPQATKFFDKFYEEY